MKNIKVAIIGGGLSGLYTAYLLEKQGITDYVLLEAREALGGRISSVSTGNASIIDHFDHFDLGPTWFWPDFQHQLGKLITELELESFKQYETGNMVVERSPNEPPILMRGYASSPPSMRLSGGMKKLVQALYSRLREAHILCNTSVRSIQHKGDHLEVHFQNTHDTNTTDQISVQHVLLAMPPRLVASHIHFIPKLPTDLDNQWRNTATWMAGHAKYIAVYDTPFWREKGLSGSAQSRLGPMVEIHDASVPNGSAALFGFLGVPASTRQNISNQELKTHCLKQFIRLFGEQASFPKLDALKDWSQDPFTATPLDFDEMSHHGSAPKKMATDGLWQKKLIGVGSEWSAQFPGYLAGAIEAAENGVSEYLSQTLRNTE